VENRRAVIGRTHNPSTLLLCYSKSDVVCPTLDCWR